MRQSTGFVAQEPPIISDTLEGKTQDDGVETKELGRSLDRGTRNGWTSLGEPGSVPKLWVSN
jgi:hypothetical protein